MVGQTFQAVIAAQFENLRDGDRNFFPNQRFSPQLMQQIQNTTLSDLIMRDANTPIMQADALTATKRHSSDVASPNPDAQQLVIGINDNNAQISGSPNVDNTIVAGLGTNQQLTGGGSSNRIVFLGSGHNDTITDFGPRTDLIDFENTMSRADFLHVTISSSGNGSTVHYDNNTIHVAGVTPDQLMSSQFLFNQNNPALLAQQ